MLRNIHFQKWNKDRYNFMKTIYGHNIKWDHFDILASGKTDYHCKIKETLLIQELKPALNVNVSSEKLILY